MPELGPERLDRERQRYIWMGKGHLSLKDLREHLNHYACPPRLRGRSTLVRAVAAAIDGMLPGPLAYAASWDEAAGSYRGLAIDSAENVHVVIENESLIVRPDAAEAHLPQPRVSTKNPSGGSPSSDSGPTPANGADVVDDGQPTDQERVRGRVALRPALGGRNTR